MEKQEFIEMMQGIEQIQSRYYVPKEKLKDLLTRLSVILDIEIDWEVINQTFTHVQSTHPSSAYYAIHSNDSRCLILIEGFQSFDAVVRCEKFALSEVIQAFEECKIDYMTDCLIDRSYVGKIVRYYHLPILYVGNNKGNPMLHSREFWMEYFFVNESFNLHSETRSSYLFFTEPISFTVGKEFEMFIDLDQAIYLSVSQKPYTNRYILDDEDFLSFILIFRWSELEALCRYVAPQYKEIPGIPLLLLYRFCVFEESDPMEEIQQKVTSAWRSLGLFSESEIEYLVQTFCRVSPQLRWDYDSENGWYYATRIVEFTFGSVRCKGNVDFPFELYHRFFEFIKKANRQIDMQTLTQFDRFLLEWSKQASDVETQEFSLKISQEMANMKLEIDDLPF